MSSNWKRYEEQLNTVERILTRIQMWPSKRTFLPIRYTVLSFLLTFCALFPIKIIINFEGASLVNGVVNLFGCFMAISFTFRLIHKEDRFIEIFKFIREDLKTPPSDVKKEILAEISGEIGLLFKYIAYVFPMAVFPKFLSPFIEYGFFKLTESDSNVTLALPPSMAVPRMPFLPYDDFIIYVIECSVRIVMLGWIMCPAFIFVTSSLYLGTEFRVLASQLKNTSVDDKDVFKKCIQRHDELIRVTKKLTKLYNVHIFMEIFVSYINLAALFLALFAGNARVLDFFNDLLMMMVGGFQFVIMNLYSDKLMHASLTVYYGAYEADWVGKSVTQQKKLLFMIARARKPCTVSIAGDFGIGSLELMMNLCKDSYAAYNILKTTIGN